MSSARKQSVVDHKSTEMAKHADDQKSNVKDDENNTLQSNGSVNQPSPLNQSIPDYLSTNLMSTLQPLLEQLVLIKPNDPIDWLATQMLLSVKSKNDIINAVKNELKLRQEIRNEVIKQFELSGRI